MSTPARSMPRPTATLQHRICFIPLALLLLVASLSGCGPLTRCAGSYSSGVCTNVIVLTSIQISPGNPSITTGANQQFTAMGTFDDGSKQDVTDSITWRSSDPSLATADHHGLVSALAIGRPTITANSDNVKASTTLIVLGNASADVARFAFVANMADSTLSAFTVNPASGQLRHNGYQLVGSLPASVGVDPRGKFVYVANSNDSSISAFVIDSSGNLASVPGSPFKDSSNPVALVVDPSGDFLYSANSGSGNVAAYSIDVSSGVLTPLAGSPFAAGANPESLAIDSSAKFLYVANPTSNNVSAYTIDPASGTLASVNGSPFTAGASPSALSLDPAGHALYVANSVSTDVSAFTVDGRNGKLSPVAGSPFPTGAGQEISGITVTPNGKFVLISNFGSTSISVLAVDSSGALASAPGSPFPVDSSPRAVQIDPAGKFAYVPQLSACEVEIFSIAADGSLTVSNRIRTRQQAASIAFSLGSAAITYTPKFLYATNMVSNNISAFAVAPNGSLSQIPGAPFTTGANPFGVATTPSGKFVYVSNGLNSSTNTYEKSISAFSVGSGGSLTAVQGSPFPAGTGTAGLTVDPSGRFLYAANFYDFTLSAYTINPSNGALTPIAGSPFATGQEPVAVSIDPSGRFVYVANQRNDCGNPVTNTCPISAFKIDAATGSLTDISGPLSGGGEPSGLAIDPTGKSLYLASQGAAFVSQYSINVDGTLAYITSSTPPPSTAAVSVTTDLSGKIVFSDFALFPGSTLNTFLLDTSSGNLPPIPSSSVTAGYTLFNMTLDPSGKYLYVPDKGAPNSSGQIWAYSLDPMTGILTAVPSSPFATGTETASVAVTGRIQ
jgi:6-phosphogluconolactonase